MNNEYRSSVINFLSFNIFRSIIDSRISFVFEKIFKDFLTTILDFRVYQFLAEPHTLLENLVTHRSQKNLVVIIT